MRFWQGTTITIPVRWFRAAATARVLGERTVYGSRVWDKQDGPADFGEVVGERPGYEKGANNQGYLGLDWCGSREAWMDGGVEGRDHPIHTDAEGVSSCCQLANQVARGGEVVGGSALLPWGALGGTAEGGALTSWATNGIFAVGGTVEGGEALGPFVNQQIARGGTAVNGSAQFPGYPILRATGGERVAGEAVGGLANRWSARGGEVLDGAATWSSAVPILARGGEVLDGEQTFAGEGPYMPAIGGELVNGSADQVLGVLQVAEGGEVVNDHAEMAYGAQLRAEGGEVVNGVADQGGEGGPAVRSVSSITGQFDAFLITRPDPVEEDDVLLIMVCSLDADGPVVTLPSGFTESSNASVSSVFRVAVGWKVATGSEPDEYTVGQNELAVGSAVMCSVGPGSLDVEPDDYDGGSGPEASAPSVTASAGSSLLLSLFSSKQGDGMSTPTGMDAEVSVTNVAGSLLVASQSVAAGATGDRVSDLGEDEDWFGVNCVVAP